MFCNLFYTKTLANYELADLSIISEILLLKSNTFSIKNVPDMKSGWVLFRSCDLFWCLWQYVSTVIARPCNELRLISALGAVSWALLLNRAATTFSATYFPRFYFKCSKTTGISKERGWNNTFVILTTHELLCLLVELMSL